ncbi:putative multispanning membrane protein [Zopfia rhizophila CBS 207.26]|uniref:Transmembrane 9 superfamily member n=1 Tax=Zopfia rhizophila CBS 207.26 TaxID=1314779 RepID=A0A6A6DSI1_9PEZI|nr:putative multispanning membrane protein [Zopfia rhizophila CBS 207.26]
MHADVRRNVIFCSLLALSQAFYIPGFSIKSYRDGETIPLFVNKVYSDYSELQYAYTELPFVCAPTGRIQTGRFTSGASLSLNLGEVLRGDRITVSDYELIMGTDEEARYLCSHTVNRDGLKRTKELIRDGYVAEWIVDNLPGATSFKTTDKSRKYYAAGFKIGEEIYGSPGSEAQYFLNNHVTLVIRYHRAPGKDGDQGKKVIVGFEVFPKSIEAGNRTEQGLPADIQNVESGLELIPRSNATGEIDDTDGATLTIPYTYSVYFREEDKLEWQNRWDMYFVAQDDSSNIHWLAIVNSLVIAGLLTAVVAVIVTRTIRGDIKVYKEGGLEEGKPKSKRARGIKSPRKSTEKNGLLEQIADIEGEADMSSDEESIEDITGWKLVHGDVFRPPPYGGLLAPLVGSGTQLVFMATGLLILSSLGVLNPSFRGGYVSVGTGLFVVAGLFSGYFSSRVYKTFGGQLWQKNVLVTATLIPGLLFTTVFILNLFVWAQASSTAIPFGTLVGLVALWLLIQLPLVYIGGWYGYIRVGAWSHPIKANAIPRQIPSQSWYTKSFQAVLAGFIPFAVIFIELMFVFKSLWLDKSGYYYVFGFLAVVSVILVVTVTEVTIVATYVQLCSENYHWWWQSFIVGGSSSIWIFGYLVWYYFTKLHITGFVSSLLFFCYGFLACVVYGLLTGTIGFLSAYAFVRRIYGYVFCPFHMLYL